MAIMNWSSGELCGPYTNAESIVDKFIEFSSTIDMLNTLKPSLLDLLKRGSSLI